MLQSKHIKSPHQNLKIKIRRTEDKIKIEDTHLTTKTPGSNRTTTVRALSNSFFYQLDIFVWLKSIM